MKMLVATRMLVATMILAVPLVAAAADNPDATFFKKAAEAGIAEVDLGNLSGQKGASQQVKDFGAMMVKDHSAANDKLKSLASSKGIDLPTSASIGDMAEKAKLEVLSGDTFDKSYIKGQIKAHKAAIHLFSTESKTGQDADAKAFATATLPTLRSHMKAARAAAASVGVSTK